MFPSYSRFCATRISAQKVAWASFDFRSVLRYYYYIRGAATHARPIICGPGLRRVPTPGPRSFIRRRTSDGCSLRRGCRQALSTLTSLARV